MPLAMGKKRVIGSLEPVAMIGALRGVPVDGGALKTASGNLQEIFKSGF